MPTARRHDERALTFAARPGFRLPAFPRTVDERTSRLEATHWDSADGRLRSWGHDLRYGRAPGDVRSRWTLDLGAATDGSGTAGTRGRVELRAGGRPDRPPPALVELLQTVLAGAPLVAIASTDTRRRAVTVELERGGTVEVRDDRVTARAAGSSPVRVRRVEVEAGNDARDRSLRPITRRLHDAGAERTRGDGVAQSLDEWRAHVLELERPPLRRSATVRDVVGAAIADGTHRLIAHDPAARLGDPEAVHQARVATRRLRSDVKTLQPALDRSRTDRIRDDLAWVGEALGAVRDLDVLIARVTARSDVEDPHERSDRARAIDALRERRIEALRRLRRALASRRYASLIARLRDASAHPPTRGGKGRRAAGPFLRKRVRAAWRRTSRFADHLDADPANAELHELRKRAKRARYAAELSSDLFGRDADRFAEALADLQGALGDLQDTVAGEERLRGLVAGSVGDDLAFAVGTLVGAERGERGRLRSSWHDVWDAARRRKLRAWLR